MESPTFSEEMGRSRWGCAVEVGTRTWNRGLWLGCKVNKLIVKKNRKRKRMKQASGAELIVDPTDAHVYFALRIHSVACNIG